MAVYPDAWQRNYRSPRFRSTVAPDPWQRGSTTNRFRPGKKAFNPLRPSTSYPKGKKERDGRPVGQTQDGRIIYQDPNTGQIWAEAERRTREMVNPLLQRIDQRMAEEQALARQEAERQNTGFDASVAKARPELAGAYDTGIQQASAVEEAVRKNLAGEGATAGAALAEKLKAINAPGTEVADLAGVYSGAGGAGYASGMSDVSNLVSRAAEAKAWLEKQPLAFREQTAQDLADALSEIGSDYRGQRADIEAGIPAQIQNLYESLFGQATDKSRFDYERKLGVSDRAEDRRRYDAELRAKTAADSRANRLAERKAELESWLAAVESGNDLEAKRLKNQAAKNERTWRAKQARLDREASHANALIGAGYTYDEEGNLVSPEPDRNINTPSDRDRYIIDEQGNVIGLNPNYRPEKPGKGSDPKVQMRLKMNTASKNIRNILFNPNSQTQRDWVTNAKSWNDVVPRINAEISDAGINPQSPQGIELRKNAFRRLGVQTGPNGNPVGKSNRKPRGGR